MLYINKYTTGLNKIIFKDKSSNNITII